MLRLLHSWSSFSLAHVPHPRLPSPQSSGRGRAGQGHQDSTFCEVSNRIGGEGGRARRRGIAGGSLGFRQQG